MPWLITIAVLIPLAWIVKKLLHRKKIRKLYNSPFPEEWVSILEENLPVYRHLPDDLKEQLKHHINVFLGEKEFEGCGGLKITDEIRVTVAAQACILLLNNKTRYYPGLHTILMYPTGYFGKDQNGEDDRSGVRLGESWTHGPVVLSWNDVKSGGMNDKDGHNVVMHEFAHQLDQEDGAAEGLPILEKRAQYKTWPKVLGKEFEHFVKLAKKHRKTVMDHYGATNPAEFFAVLTETFYEKPRQLHRKHPELYIEMKDYYNVDPLEWYSHPEDDGGGDQ